jgi:hypothetical protein
VILGVSRQRAAQLADSAEFPGPIADLASGRVWRVQDVRLWSEIRRRGGRPRTGYRIEYAGERDEKRKGRRTVSLAVIWIDQPGMDRIYERWIDRDIAEFVARQLETHRPPMEASLSVRRALAGICGLQLRREIEDGNFLIDAVPLEAPLVHKWFQFLGSQAEGIQHPIPDLRLREVLHLWIRPGAELPRVAENAGAEHVHMECGHWIERRRLPKEVIVYLTEATCPTCGKVRRVVGLWPQR